MKSILVDAESSVVHDKYGTTLFPETWFIDQQGLIRARFDGGRSWATPMTIDLAESLNNPIECAVAFEGGKPHGPMASLCGEFTPGSN